MKNVRTYDFGFTVRPALRLREIELILRRTRVITPVPSRPTLIGLIECGKLEGRKLSHGWMVYEDSFKKWVKSFQPEAYESYPPPPYHRREEDQQPGSVRSVRSVQAA
ncbi:MAG: hypothetical protein ABW208_07215 [Pyrinomonadaceae bacterium]